MNFLLETEEKKAFLNVLGMVMMFDNRMCNPEEEILDEIKIIIDLTDYDPPTPLVTKKNKMKLNDINKKIIDEINKIHSIIPVVYLFNILYDLEKHHTMQQEFNFKSRITSILDDSNRHEEVKKSNLFLYNKTAIKQSKNKDKNKLSSSSAFQSFYNNVIDFFDEKTQSSNITSRESKDISDESVELGTKEESKIDTLHKNLKEKGE